MSEVVCLMIEVHRYKHCCLSGQMHASPVLCIEKRVNNLPLTGMTVSFKDIENCAHFAAA
jgi:hypothetical protein